MGTVQHMHRSFNRTSPIFILFLFVSAIKEEKNIYRNSKQQRVPHKKNHFLLSIYQLEAAQKSLLEKDALYIFPPKSFYSLSTPKFIQNIAFAWGFCFTFTYHHESGCHSCSRLCDTNTQSSQRTVKLVSATRKLQSLKPS